jgi:hypothetical protein
VPFLFWPAARWFRRRCFLIFIGSPLLEEKAPFLILTGSPLLEHDREGHGFSRAKKPCKEAGL